jgi:hypothetical protein
MGTVMGTSTGTVMGTVMGAGRNPPIMAHAVEG